MRFLTHTTVRLLLVFCFGSLASAASLSPEILWKSGLHTGFVNAVAISPHGVLMASASGDTTVKLWRLADGVVVRTLAGHLDLVNAVAFSPDGQLLATGSADLSVKLWRVADGTLLHTLMGHTEFVSCVAFSADGATLISGGGDATLRCWRVADGARLRTLFGHLSTVWSVDVSPDGTLLASGSGSLLDASGAGENTIKLWQSSDGNVVRTLEGHGADVWCIRFSPDGSMLASGSGDKSIRLWRVNDGALVRTLTGHSAAVLSVAFCPDGRTLASGSRPPDNTLKFWRVTDGALLTTYNQETYFINSLGFSPDGARFGYGRDDRYVVVARNAFAPIGPPQILLPPQNRTAPCDGQALFRVNAAGSPPLRFQWLFNGTNLPHATNAVLMLTQVRASDAGTYQAVASNGMGAVTSAPAQLTVFDSASSLAPTLSVTRQVDTLIVSWPRTCLAYELEETERLDADTLWVPGQRAFPAEDGTMQAVLARDGGSRFVRLRQVLP